MNLLETLKHNIAGALSTTKAYDLPAVCSDLGLDPGEDAEAWSSKYKYVLRRAQRLSEEAAIRIAKEILKRGEHYQLQETLDLLIPMAGSVSAITRRRIIDALDGSVTSRAGYMLMSFSAGYFPSRKCLMMATTGVGIFKRLSAST